MSQKNATNAELDMIDWTYGTEPTTRGGFVRHLSDGWIVLSDLGRNAQALAIFVADNSDYYNGTEQISIGGFESGQASLSYYRNVDAEGPLQLYGVSGEIDFQFKFDGYNTGNFHATLENGKEIFGSFNIPVLPEVDFAAIQKLYSSKTSKK